MLHFAPGHTFFIIALTTAAKTTPRIIRNHANYNGHSFISIVPSPFSGRHPSISFGLKERRGDSKDEAAAASEEGAADEHGKK